MSSKQIWLGIPTKRMQWVPAPLADAQSSNVGFLESIEFDNGGTDVERSSAYRKVYNFEFNAPLKGSEKLNVFNKFASGFYGDGLIYFADPFIFESNLFPAHWASPGLLEQGWPEIYTTDATFTDTASNSYLQPPRTANWSFSAGASTVPTPPYGSVTIAVPEGYTLHFGYSGAVTGNGRVYYQTIAADGTIGASTAITALSATSATRLNTTVASTSAVAVRFFIGATGAGAATVAITSMMAQLWPTGSSPTLTGEHIPGEGHTGLVFADAARPETYVYIDPPRKALSTSLVEVGAWRKA
jgi:hypothetical protein